MHLAYWIFPERHTCVCRISKAHRQHGAQCGRARCLMWWCWWLWNNSHWNAVVPERGTSYGDNFYTDVFFMRIYLISLFFEFSHYWYWFASDHGCNAVHLLDQVPVLNTGQSDKIATKYVQQLSCSVHSQSLVSYIHNRLSQFSSYLFLISSGYNCLAVW